jgi:large subunit ribosomal protein L31e
MAKDKKEPVQLLEREYVVPLRRKWLKVPEYKRGNKAVKTLKEFMVRHMKIYDRDLRKVKIDIDLNNELRFRGIRKPPSKVRVKAKKFDNGSVKVELVNLPKHIEFKKKKLAKIEDDKKKKKKVKLDGKDEENEKEIGKSTKGILDNSTENQEGESKEDKESESKEDKEGESKEDKEGESKEDKESESKEDKESESKEDKESESKEKEDSNEDIGDNKKEKVEEKKYEKNEKKDDDSKK